MPPAHLFNCLRGSNNLVFPNSRREVERYTNLLNKLCEAKQVPNEFWPHHDSLSKEIHSETETALKQKEQPAPANCTNALELGIDIGAVKSVAQIGPPPSVASLSQRLGRSGRRKGEPTILRGYCVEDDILLANVKNLQREKWDWALPDVLLRKAYASLYLNLDDALGWVRALPGAGAARN